jgi:2-iminobutanoate/2-iminopropanoate deaminase
MLIKKLISSTCFCVVVSLVTGCAVSIHGGKQVMSTNKTYPTIGPYSQMVGYGNIVYFSGVIPLNLAGSAVQGSTIREQTRLVLDYIGVQLGSQGLSYDDVLMSTVYLKDLDDFAAMNGIYAEYFRKNPPARATVEVARLPRDVKIEIAVIAGRR